MPLRPDSAEARAKKSDRTRSSRKASGGWLLHPFLFCLWPLLELFGRNVAEVALGDFVVWAAGALAAVVLVLGLLRLVLTWHKSALVTSWLVLVFFLYPAGHRALAANERPWLAAGVVAATVALLVLVFWSRSSLRTLTTAMNFMSAVVVALSLVTLASSLAEIRQARSDLLVEMGSVDLPEYRPDIFYVILDGYGSEQVLGEYYDLDIGPFVRELEQLGFYVAGASRSNYPRTVLSLPSSLNMAPLEQVDPKFWAKPRKRKAVRRWLTRRVGDAALPRELRRRGYDFHLITSAWGASGRSRWATRVHACRGISEFGAQVLKNSLPALWKLGKHALVRNPRRELILCQFETLEKSAALPGPKYVFTHLLVPHGPWLFRSDGRAVQPGDYRGPQAGMDGYREQVQYVNQRLITTLTTILEVAGPDTIVVIQGDHGPSYAAKRRRVAVKRRMKKLSYPEVRRMLSPKGEFAPFVFERMSILNAYHLPRQGASRLYPEITPVNSFRLIFDHYFGTSLGLEPDASFYALQKGNAGYWGFDVTETVRLESAPVMPSPGARRPARGR